MNIVLHSRYLANAAMQPVDTSSTKKGLASLVPRAPSHSPKRVDWEAGSGHETRVLHE